MILESHSSEALQILGLSQGYSLGELKKAFKAKALKMHPDVGGNERDFIKLKSAFDMLAKQAGASSSEIEKMKSGLFPGNMKHQRYATLDDELAELDRGTAAQRRMAQHIRDKIASGEEWETGGERLAKIVDRSGYTPLLSLVVSIGELSDYKQLSPRAIEVNPDTFDFGKLLDKLDKHEYLDVEKSKDYGTGELVLRSFGYEPKLRGEKENHMRAFVSIPQLRIDEWNKWTFVIKYNPNKGQLWTDASYKDENDLKRLN
jgi:hypothetical protein